MIAEFTTAATTQEASPPAPALDPLGTPDVWPYGGTSCGEWGRCSRQLPIRGVSTSMALRVYRGDVWIADFPGATSMLTFGSTRGVFLNPPDVIGDGDFQLYAIDAAGNRSAPAMISVPTCEIPLIADAGMLLPDAGVGDPSVQPSDDGCALASTRTSSLGLALALLALTRRRRT